MTARWWSLLAGSVITGALAVLLAWPELLGLAAAGLLLSVVVPLSLGLRPRGTSAVSAAPTQVARGSDVGVDVDVKWNVAPKGPWTTIVSTDELARRSRAWLRGRRQDHARWMVDTGRRGVARSSPDAIVQQDPYGLTYRVVGEIPRREALVVPRVFDVPLALRTTSSRDGSDGTRRGDEQFHTLREYVFGDEMRTVHWRSSARAGKLLVKESVAPMSTAVCVCIDTDPDAFSDVEKQAHFEAAVDMAASLAAAALKPGISVVVMSTDGNFQPSRHTQVTLGHVLADLAMVQLASPTDVSTGAVDIALRHLSVSDFIVVTGIPGRRAATTIVEARRWVGNVRIVNVAAPSGGTA